MSASETPFGRIIHELVEGQAWENTTNPHSAGHVFLGGWDVVSHLELLLLLGHLEVEVQLAEKGV